MRRPCTTLALLVAALASGCAQETIHHGDPALSESSNSFGSFSGGGSVSGSPFDGPNFDGNYPNPAVTRCGDVLGDLPAIDGLASAWALIAVPGATRDGEPVETGTVLLRISERMISDCGSEAVTSFATGGQDRMDLRDIEVMLGPDEFTVGEHPVSELAAPAVRLLGDGETEDFGTSAQVELLHVDDDCVIGILRGFEGESGEPFMEGGFVAQTCQRQCIPSDTNDC